MNFNSRKALLGEITTTFIATIAVVIILLVFALLSAVLKPSGQMGYDESRAYVDIFPMNYQNTFIVEKYLNCLGDFQGEKRSLFEVLPLWDSSNSDEVMKLVESCAAYSVVYIENDDINKIIRCDNGCKTENLDSSNALESFTQLSPYKIKISVGFYT